jgi:predicted NAD/FAD-binding protein
MSFACHVRPTDESYAVNFRAGAPVPAGVMTDSALRPILGEVARFLRTAQTELARGGLGDQTLGEFLAAHRFSRRLAERYVLPMGAALWSVPPRQIEQFPAHAYFAFFDNHGLLGTGDSGGWQHVRGGSRRYVDRLIARLVAAGGVVRTGAEVVSVNRRGDGAELTTRSGGTEPFDAVVLATHADHSLRILTDADPAERAWLGAFRYQSSSAVLHTDRSVMPRRRDHWASWNVELEAGDDPGERPVCITYHLNKLQGLGHRATDWFVTLNRTAPIDSTAILARAAFEHPMFDRAAIRAQARVAEVSGRRAVYFCGAYLGHGFHEDGVRSGVAVADALGSAW